MRNVANKTEHRKDMQLTRQASSATWWTLYSFRILSQGFGCMCLPLTREVAKIFDF